MFPEEVDKIEKYIGGLPDMILGSVKASKSKTMQEVIEFTTELMEDKTHAYAERQAERKRKYDDLSKNNQNQQNKRQNTGQAYCSLAIQRSCYRIMQWWIFQTMKIIIEALWLLEVIPKEKLCTANTRINTARSFL
ncbi:hypothetical protein Tco_0224208 [Tanacetum coccineum]